MSLQDRIVYVVVKWDDYDMREGTLERIEEIKAEINELFSLPLVMDEHLTRANQLGEEANALEAEKRRAETNNGYALIGVFTSEQAAIEACETDLHAYTVMVLDHALTSRLFRADDNWCYPLDTQQETK